MEKIMIIGIAALLGLLTAVPPKPIARPFKPDQGPHTNGVVVVREPSTTASPDRPVKLPVTAEPWHDPR